MKRVILYILSVSPSLVPGIASKRDHTQIKRKSPCGGKKREELLRALPYAAVNQWHHPPFLQDGWGKAPPNGTLTDCSGTREH